MNLYLIRHGSAEDYATGGDAERRLTRQGTFQVAMIAKGLKKLGVTFNRIVASPLARARETAEIIARIVEFDGEIETDRRMLPETRYEDVSDLLGERGDAETVLLVGHQPSIGNITSGLCTGSQLDMEVETATIRAFDIHRMRPFARGTLLWTLTPKVVEALMR
jgi:phosphohistidine phosphatase